MGWLKIFGHEEAKEVLCPYCDKPAAGHDTQNCAERGMNRRSFFFMGLMGASAAALSARLEGIPLPTARVQVVARWRDLIDVKDATGPWRVAYEDARRVSDPARVYKAPNGSFASAEAAQRDPGGLFHTPKAELTFALADVGKTRISPALEEMRILAVVDAKTGRPLKYRIYRHDVADRVIADRRAAYQKEQSGKRESERREYARRQRIREAWGDHVVVANGAFPAPIGYTRVMDPGEGIFVDVPAVTAKLATLKARHPKHPMVQALWRAPIRETLRPGRIPA